MQQDQPRPFSVRRLLLPFNGEEPLTRAQGARVIVSWAIFFPVVLLIGTVPFVLLVKNTSLQQAALLLLAIFLLGVVIFGGLAWFVVFMLNRSARILQDHRALMAAKNNTPSGGRYGS
ncbi:MAG: hypothetical protein NVS2B12_28320 [Ktedonobacteraceae bacterium]